MRNFDDRKTEVFRRSEMRIKAIKKRRRIILSCSVLLLVTAICLPFLRKYPETYEESLDNVLIEGTVDITTEDESIRNDDADFSPYSVEILSDEVCTMTRDMETYERTVSILELIKAEGADDFDDIAAQGGAHRITLYNAENGESAHYTLVGSILTDDDGTRYQLSKEHLQMLKEALGINE